MTKEENLEKIKNSISVKNLTDIVDLFNLFYKCRDEKIDSNAIIDLYNNRDIAPTIKEVKEPESVKPRMLYKAIRIFFSCKGLTVSFSPRDYGIPDPEMNEKDTESAEEYLFGRLEEKWMDFVNCKTHKEACSLIFPLSDQNS
jgi:hypothetical protein